MPDAVLIAHLRRIAAEAAAVGATTIAGILRAAADRLEELSRLVV